MRGLKGLANHPALQPVPPAYRWKCPVSGCGPRATAPLCPVHPKTRMVVAK